MFASPDPRYKVFSPNWARIEELGVRGLDTKTIKTAFKYGQIKLFLTYTAYLSSVMNLSYTDKDPANDPPELTRFSKFFTILFNVQSLNIQPSATIMRPTLRMLPSPPKTLLHAV